MFKGKKVCLLGPAPHIAEVKHDYSQYDFICRVNAMIPVPELVAVATTNRTDVWYTCYMLLKKYPELCAIPGVLRITQGQKEFVPQKFQKKISLMNPHFNRLKAAVGCTPNRGMRAMVDILDSKPKLLYVSGITFYKGKSYYEGYGGGLIAAKETDGNTNAHKQDPQFQYFIKHIYPFIKTDSVLKEIVENHLKPK